MGFAFATAVLVVLEAMVQLPRASYRYRTTNVQLVCQNIYA
jgi:hypothetical protein